MAYSQGAITPDHKTVHGRRLLVFQFAETEVGVASEATIPNVPTHCTLMRVMQKTSNGAGGFSTTQPRFSGVTGDYTVTAGGYAGTSAGSTTDVQPATVGTRLYLPSGNLYMQSRANIGTCDTQTTIFLMEGWDL